MDIDKLRERKINSTQIFDGKVIKIYKDLVQCPNGNNSYREIVKHHGGVCILAIDKDNNVFMEKQYRYAYDEVLYELPAGKLEENEVPLDAAYRDFEEETGYKAINLKSLGVMYPTCGYSNEIIYLFFTNDFIKTSRHLDDDEEIEIIKMPLNEIIDYINDNTIKDAKTICAVSKYLLLKNKK